MNSRTASSVSRDLPRGHSPSFAGPGLDVGRMWDNAGAASLPNAFTCDVEDYFHVGAFESVIPQSRWSELECRVPRNVDRILELLSDADAKGTFFTLGWIAERMPNVIRRIADAGHEIASHGMRHMRVFRQTPEEFQHDVTAAKHLLEDASGTPVRGYRAASWSFNANTAWMHRVLAEAGYEYSSSIFPIAHDHYGVPSAPAVPFYVRGSGILEIPATTVRLLGRNWPAAGGGYFRLLPLSMSLWLMRRAREALAVPAMFYFHPWEIDPGQPRVAGASARARFRHYVNLDKTESRLKVLLATFPWDRMDRIFRRAGQPV